MVKNQQHAVQPHPLVQRAVDLLRDYGLHAAIDRTNVKVGRLHFDAILRVHKGGAETLLMVEAKPELNPATIALVLQQRARDNGTLLVANHIPPPMAAKLRENRIAFLDVAGNAWIQTPEFLIWVEGKKPTQQTPAAMAPRAFQTRGLQLLFALLTNPDWIALTTRELAARVGVANGTVAAVLRDLEALGYVMRGNRRTGPRRLRNQHTLIQKWTEGYLQRFQATTLLNRYRRDFQEPHWWKDVDAQRHHAILGGEPAAALLTGFLTPDIITIYLDGNPGPLILDKKLRQDPNGNVVLRRKFWKFEAEGWTHNELVPPLLIYADLMGIGDARCIETAGRIRDEYLTRTLED